MTEPKVLIVEDEILIADIIRRYLEREAYQVVGIAISYEEAVALYHAEQPDLVLLDVRLSGVRNGVDFAHYLRSQDILIPFLYLTSQVDRLSIDAAKKTFPAGYLSKPIQVGSLMASIEIALHNYRERVLDEQLIRLNDGNNSHKVPIKDIWYLMSDHIYVRLYSSEGDSYMHRGALKDLIKELPKPPFMQVHRSYAVNLSKITAWDLQQLFIGSTPIPVSRARRRAVFEYLESGLK